MKALLICPGDRPGVAALTEALPLSNVPILGKAALEYWLEHLVTLSAREVLILAADRPDAVRALVGDGARWGLSVCVQAEHYELTADQARVRYCERKADWLPAPRDAVVVNHLPGLPEVPFGSKYADWFAAVRTWLPRAATPDRIGLRELKPGVWAGLHSHIAPDAELRSPCWIGENVQIESGALLGPNAVIENNSVVARHAEIADSIVGPETFVGEYTEIHSSIAWGNMLVNWQRNSCVRVPDPFLLCSLEPPHPSAALAGTIARITSAFAALLPASRVREYFNPAIDPTSAENQRTS